MNFNWHRSRLSETNVFLEIFSENSPFWQGMCNDMSVNVIVFDTY